MKRWTVRLQLGSVRAGGPAELVKHPHPVTDADALNPFPHQTWWMTVVVDTPERWSLRASTM